MDVHALYETWCFISVVCLVASMMKRKGGLQGLIQVEQAGIRVRLRRGQQSAVTFVGDGCTISVTYGPEYSGLTGTQRPDIILRFQHDGWPDLIIVFDANITSMHPIPIKSDSEQLGHPWTPSMRSTAIETRSWSIRLDMDSSDLSSRG